MIDAGVDVGVKMKMAGHRIECCKTPVRQLPGKYLLWHARLATDAHFVIPTLQWIFIDYTERWTPSLLPRCLEINLTDTGTFGLARL
jgi:hypothetical protein